MLRGVGKEKCFLFFFYFYPSLLRPSGQCVQFSSGNIFFLHHSLWCWLSHNNACLLHTPPPLLYPSSVSLSSQRQAKYSENKLKCTKARNDYLLNLAATNAVVAKYYIHDVSDMIDVSTRGACVFVFISPLGSRCWFNSAALSLFLTICLCRICAQPVMLPSCSSGFSECFSQLMLLY